MPKHAGFFERQAITARERRRLAIAEFSQEDIAPLELLEMSHEDFHKMSVRRVKQVVADKRVLFLHDRTKSTYAMVLSPSLMLLLEIRDVLNDRTKYTTVPETVGGGA